MLILCSRVFHIITAQTFFLVELPLFVFTVCFTMHNSMNHKIDQVLLWFKGFSKEFWRILILRNFSYLGCLIRRIINHRNLSIGLICTRFHMKLSIHSTLFERSLHFFLCTTKHLYNPVGFKTAFHSNPMFFLFPRSGNPTNQRGTRFFIKTNWFEWDEL